MLENWCYEQPILQRLSKHYKTGSPLPEDLRNQLVAAKKAYLVPSEFQILVINSFSAVPVSCTRGSSSLATLTWCFIPRRDQSSPRISGLSFAQKSLVSLVYSSTALSSHSL